MNSSQTNQVPTNNGKLDDKLEAGDIPVMEEIDVEALVDRCLKLLREESQDENHHCASQHCPNKGFNGSYKQVFIGIAGTPGSGKSYIAEQVRDAINNKQNLNAGDGSKLLHEPCVVIGMDGYHMTRATLQQKADAGEKFKTDENGTVEYKKMSYEELLSRRGAGFTYNPQAFIQDLEKLKETGHGSFPIYDRSKHDPVPDGVSIGPHNKIILVEGLYLLCLHDPEWQPLDDLWDDKWYIDVSMEETRRRLVKRHLKNWNDEKTERWGGNDEAAAGRKAETNDLVNAACIKRMSPNKANIIIKNEGIPENDANNADVDAAE